MFFFMKRIRHGEGAGLWSGVVFDLSPGGKTVFWDAVVDCFGELVPVDVREV